MLFRSALERQLNLRALGKALFQLFAFAIVAAYRKFADVVFVYKINVDFLVGELGGEDIALTQVRGADNRQLYVGRGIDEIIDLVCGNKVAEKQFGVS